MTKKSAELRRSWSLSIISTSGFIRALREVPIRGRVTLVRGYIGGQIVAVVVVRAVPGQGQQPDECDRDRHDQNRCRATGRRGRRSCATRASVASAWVQVSCRNALPLRLTAAPSVNAAATTTTMPMANGMPSVWKYGRLVKCRQNVAPAMVKPDPSTT